MHTIILRCVLLTGAPETSITFTPEITYTSPPDKNADLFPPRSGMYIFMHANGKRGDLEGIFVDRRIQWKQWPSPHLRISMYIRTGHEELFRVIELGPGNNVEIKNQKKKSRFDSSKTTTNPVFPAESPNLSSRLEKQVPARPSLWSGSLNRFLSSRPNTSFDFSRLSILEPRLYWA